MKFTEKVKECWEDNKEDIAICLITSTAMLTVTGITAYTMSKYACNTIDAHAAKAFNNVPNIKLGALFDSMCDEVYNTGNSATRRIHNSNGERFNATLTLTPVSLK